MLSMMIELTHENAKLPQFLTEHAACADIYLPQTVHLPPTKENIKIPLGFKLHIPKDYCVKIHLRSSVGRDYPVILSNGVGIVDSDFRGEVMLYMRNMGYESITFEKGQRICQMELQKINHFEWIQVAKIADDTERGLESGSTGKF